jgi:tetratricopeptide (TPR) repeat protein
VVIFLTADDYKNIIDQCWQLRREKRFAEAEMLLHESLETNPAGSFACRVLKANLADILMQRGSVSEARSTALEVLEEDPDQTIALTVLGMLALDKKQYSEAVENLEKAYNLVPSGYRAGRLARAYELNGDAEKALHVLREALQNNPRDGFLLRQYSNIEKKQVKTEQGKAAAESHLPGLGDLDEEDYLPYAEQIRFKLKNIKPALAVDDLQKLIKVGKRKNNPYLHLLLGDLQREAGNEEAALLAYNQARELDPQNLLAISQLLYSLRRLGRHEEAWPLLKLVLMQRPGDVTAKSSLLKDAVELGKEQETVLFFEELLQKYPQRKELYGAIRKLQNAAARKDGDD